MVRRTEARADGCEQYPGDNRLTRDAAGGTSGRQIPTPFQGS